MKKHTHAYAGFAACGCMVAVTVDDGKDGHCGNDVAEFIREGLFIRRVTIEAVRRGFKRCKHQPKKPKQDTLI